MRLFLTEVLIVITCWVLFFYVLGSGFAKLDEELQSQKSLIGREVVLNGDTSIINDYSMVMSTYSLSNGSTIHVEFARQYLVPLEGGEMIIEPK